ncbi:hypothetical protein ACHHYP_16698 [Achlya hypogyna]|uniref:PX domain-containing protein n=1 Tax=Achlya hypogyna TaxID=1202772 RepID=A0A1V9Y621_ACHHY|nr:hypothetical protein ACHHYP_16698 [Achlya hypogyna]
MFALRITSESYAKRRRGQQSFVQFHIDVAAPDAPTFTICKRFREFVALHATLVAAGFQLPGLPVSGPLMSLWLTWDSAAALAHRKFFLQVLLQHMNTSPELQAHTEFKTFVGSRPDTKPGYTSLAHFRSSCDVVRSPAPVRRTSHH